MKKSCCALFLIFALPAVLSAQTIILQDDFTQPAGPPPPEDLAGQKPSVLAAAISSNTYSGAASLFDYTGSGTVEFDWTGNYRGAYFQIGPAYTSGDVLTITADISLPDGASGWFALGFATGNTLDSTANNTPWAIFRTDANSNPGNGSLFSGPGATGGVAFDPGVNWTTGGFNTVSVVYDPNDDGDGNGVARAYVNNTLVATNSSMSGVPAAPAYLMMGGHQLLNGATTISQVDNLTVSVVPEPHTLGLLLASAAGLLALSRRRRA
jgi:hypothetical protein